MLQIVQYLKLIDFELVRFCFFLCPVFLMFTTGW